MDEGVPGVRVHVVATRGKPPDGLLLEFHAAALEIVRLLLAHGADPNHVNKSGHTLIESTRNAAIRELLTRA